MHSDHGDGKVYSDLAVLLEGEEFHSVGIGVVSLDIFRDNIDTVFETA